MEVTEEAMGSNSTDYSNSLSRAAKRTKQQRRRKRSHAAAAAADSSSASSAVLSETITEEDEDMAICLMLLAQGRTSKPKPEASSPEERADSRANIIIPQAAAAAAAGGVYECKTCNKCFPSFQALGGHRASHKKPKLEKKPVLIEEIMLPTTVDSISASFAGDAQNSKYSFKANKIHECALCGSEFSSGQALGGHMRRHRPAVNIPDLNLPAPLPAADSEAAAFAFSGERRLLFPASASTLVGCHY